MEAAPKPVPVDPSHKRVVTTSAVSGSLHTQARKGSLSLHLNGTIRGEAVLP